MYFFNLSGVLMVVSCALLLYAGIDIAGVPVDRPEFEYRGLALFLYLLGSKEYAIFTSVAVGSALVTFIFAALTRHVRQLSPFRERNCVSSPAIDLDGNRRLT